VIAVEYSNEIHTIGITLTLDNGDTFECHYPELDLDALRESYSGVLEREYYLDFPERRGT